MNLGKLKKFQHWSETNTSASLSFQSEPKKGKTMSLLHFEVYWQVFVLSLLIVIIVWKKSQYLWNKHITAWKMLCTIFIHSLFRIRNSLVRFLVLLNSWIKIVQSIFHEVISISNIIHKEASIFLHYYLNSARLM